MPFFWWNKAPTTPSPDANKDLCWWETFKDPLLTQLIREAQISNLDIEKALSVIRQARANVASSKASFFPALTGSASDTRYKSSKSGSLSGSPGTNASLFSTGFDATWELDIFGGIQRANEAAEASLASSIEDSRSVLITMMAEVAQNYINLRFYQHQYKTLKDIVHLWEEYLRAQKDLYQAGLATDIAVSSVDTSLLQAQGLVTTADTNVKQCIHQLGILLGKEPWALYKRLENIGDIPSADTVYLSCLPSKIVFERPDIRKAERDLAAATASVGVSFANLFPSFLLTGTLGWQGMNTNQLFKSKSSFFTAQPTMSFPIFDFGKLRSKIDLSEALRDEAFITFKETVLNALQEVENALTNFANEDERRMHLKDAMISDEKAYELVDGRFSAGLEDQETALQAKITALQTKINYLDSLRSRSLDIVSLYKALGGGWDTAQSLKDTSAKE